jgi:hypothetical protein
MRSREARAEANVEAGQSAGSRPPAMRHGRQALKGPKTSGEADHPAWTQGRTSSGGATERGNDPDGARGEAHRAGDACRCISAAPVAKAPDAEAHAAGCWRSSNWRERVNAPATTHAEALAAKRIRPRSFRMMTSRR